MSDVKASRPRVRDRVVATAMALIRTRVTTGLVTVLPIVVTVWLIRVVFGMMRDASLWLVEAFLDHWGASFLEAWGVQARDLAEKGLGAYPVHIQWTISIISVFLTLFLLYAIGLITANVVGRRTLALGEELVDRLPLVKTVYRSCKQIIVSFGGEQRRGFQSVVLVPFPNEFSRAVGFVTNQFKDSISGEELAIVFIPSTPNPTTGFLEVLHRRSLVELDWSVEQAVTTIMSAGLIRPEFFSMSAGVSRAPGGGQTPGQTPAAGPDHGTAPRT